MADDVVVFCREDLPTAAFPVIADIRRQGKLCDVTLKVGDQRFSAHRIILAASIPYFNAMFTHDMVEAKQGEICMQGIEPSALESLVNFAYDGRLQIEANTVQSLLIAASFLHLQCVKEACCEFLQNRFQKQRTMRAQKKPNTCRKKHVFQNKGLTCLIHLDLKITGKMIKFNENSWAVVGKYANRWKELDGAERIISETHQAVFQGSREDAVKEYGYHQMCYSRFNDKQRVERAEKRVKKVHAMECSDRKTISQDRTGPPPEKRFKFEDSSITSNDPVTSPSATDAIKTITDTFTNVADQSKASTTKQSTTDTTDQSKADTTDQSTTDTINQSKAGIAGQSTEQLTPASTEQSTTATTEQSMNATADQTTTVQSATSTAVMPPGQSATSTPVLPPGQSATSTPVLPPDQSATSTPVLPPGFCIICKKFDSYKIYLGRRIRDHVTKTCTKDGGMLREAATAVEDESILKLIRGRSCIDVGVQYHSHCYKRYVNVLDKKKEEVKPTELVPYELTFEIFSQDIIITHIIRGNEVIYLTRLLDIFKVMVKQKEKLDASDYEATELKKRLQYRFPQLLFSRPHKSTRIDIMVFVDPFYVGDISGPSTSNFGNSRLSVGKNVSSMGDRLFSTSDVGNGESSTNEITSIKKQPINSTVDSSAYNHDTLLCLYKAAMILRGELTNTIGYKGPWPPRSSDLTTDIAKSSIPTALYNTFAWAIGYSGEPTLDDKVKVDKSVDLKLVSILQDVISLQSKGVKHTPKSLALGLSIHHLTGSRKIVDLLNGLGHCDSYDIIVRYDTSLAQSQLDKEFDGLPDGLEAKTNTVLVWGNVDVPNENIFLHRVVNGIAIQYPVKAGEEMPQISPTNPNQSNDLKDEQNPFLTGPSVTATQPKNCSEIQNPIFISDTADHPKQSNLKDKQNQMFTCPNISHPKQFDHQEAKQNTLLTSDAQLKQYTHLKDKKNPMFTSPIDNTSQLNPMFTRNSTSDTPPIEFIDQKDKQISIFTNPSDNTCQSMEYIDLEDMQSIKFTNSSDITSQSMEYVDLENMQSILLNSADDPPNSMCTSHSVANAQPNQCIDQKDNQNLMLTIQSATTNRQQQQCTDQIFKQNPIYTSHSVANASPNSICTDQKHKQNPTSCTQPIHCTGPFITDELKHQLQTLYYTQLHHRQHNTDLAFIMFKYFNQNEKLYLSWEVFNTEISSSVDHLSLHKSRIVQLPVIETTSTGMDTAKDILCHSLELAERLKLNCVTLVVSLAMYAKAQQIRWTNDQFYKRLVLRPSEFDICRSYLSVIGKRFRDSGLQDVLIEAEVVPVELINCVMEGRQYHQSINAHNLMFEALSRIKFKSFYESQSEDIQLDVLMFKDNMDDGYPSDIKDLCCSDKLNKIVNLLDEYDKDKSKSSPMYSLWNSYLVMVDILLNLIRATRESNWELHVATLRSMLPWYFAYDEVEGAKYLTAYWVEMIQLQSTHPEIFQSFEEFGQWTVKHSSGHGFSSVSCDQAFQQTCDKTPPSFTLGKNALRRWNLSQNQRASIHRQCKLMAGLSNEDASTRDNSKMNRDEEMVVKIMKYLEQTVNPFTYNENELISINSGQVLSARGSKDILSAHDIGESALLSFIEDRLTSDSKPFHNPMRLLKLKTFTNHHIVPFKTKSGKDVKLQIDRRLFSRFIIISQNRKLDLQEVLKYSLGPVSYSLAGSKGCLAKTNTSVLFDLLEEKSHEPVLDSFTKDSVLILDGLESIQTLPRPLPETFGEVSKLLLSMILSEAKENSITRVDFVTAQWNPTSIKNADGYYVAHEDTQIYHSITQDQKIPENWLRFLRNGKNREAFIKFLVQHWQTTKPSTLDKISLYVTHGKLCTKFCVQRGKVKVDDVPELRCDHEDAITRMILHANHAAEMFADIILKSLNPDVAIFALSFIEDILANLYFYTGRKSDSRIIKLQKIFESLNRDTLSSLVGFHTFTGCDTTSNFYGHSKLHSYDLMIKNPNYLKAFMKLGNSFTITESLINNLEEFVCELYGQKGCSVNKARYNLFSLKTSSEHSLPPTKDALVQHIKRSNYQAAIFKRAINSNISPPCPSEHGWVISDNDISVNWMTLNPAPDKILENVYCNCLTSCDEKQCSCRVSGISCMALCKCEHCLNNVPTSDEINFDFFDKDNDEC